MSRGRLHDATDRVRTGWTCTYTSQRKNSPISRRTNSSLSSTLEPPAPIPRSTAATATTSWPEHHRLCLPRRLDRSQTMRSSVCSSLCSADPPTRLRASALWWTPQSTSTSRNRRHLMVHTHTARTSLGTQELRRPPWSRRRCRLCPITGSESCGWAKSNGSHPKRWPTD